MSDADRLREAADRLDWDASYMQPGDFPELQQERQAKTATAALLRAVADDWPCRCDYSFSMCRVHNVAANGHSTVAAALALADAVLGVTDE